jgi:hypothetical protein
MMDMASFFLLVDAVHMRRAARRSPGPKVPFEADPADCSANC